MNSKNPTLSTYVKTKIVLDEYFDIKKTSAYKRDSLLSDIEKSLLEKGARFREGTYVVTIERVVND